MSKLLTVSKCLQLNCYKIQQLIAIVTLFWTCRAFSHFTYHLRYYITIKLIIVESCYRFNELILSNYIMFMFKINWPIKVIHLQKWANQSFLNGTLMIEIASNSFSESKKNFGRLIKLRNWKNKLHMAWKYISTRFHYISCCFSCCI